MKETPNKDNPRADVEFIVEELLDLFTSAELNNEPHIQLNSSVGSTFHARVKNAAAHQDEIERLRAWQMEARAWLAQCLGYVTGEGPPHWDGIRAFLKVDK